MTRHERNSTRDGVSDLPVQAVGPLDITAAEPEALTRDVVRGLANGQLKGVHLHLVNAWVVALAQHDPDYRSAFTGSAVNLVDGRPLAWVSTLRRDTPPLIQVRGPSFFGQVLDEGRTAGVRHYLLGSSPRTLARVVAQVERRYPGAKIVGHESPPFRELTTQELAAQDARIADSGAHIVWVALGTPKQDPECRRISESTGLTTAAVGAAFDFIAGELSEAPPWMRRAGLEWLHRLATEPRRLWWRYLFGNVSFIATAFRHWRRRPGS